MVPDPSLTPELIQARTFTQGFRGYDHSEVRDFLNRIAAEVRALRERAEQLESAWRSAEERAARPPVLDEDTLMAAVGEETAAILRSARAAASDMRSKAADESEKTLSAAGEEADRIRVEAEAILAEETKNAEETAAGIVESARAEASEVVDGARAEAENIRAKAEQERSLTIEGATATRERILEDLSRRRRVATVQIEQLRAGRERLLEAYAVVRRTLEEAQEDLSRADAEARAAADEVGRNLRQDTSLLDVDADAPAPAGQAADELILTTTGTIEATPEGSAVDRLFARIRGSQDEAQGVGLPGEPTGGDTVTFGEGTFGEGAVDEGTLDGRSLDEGSFDEGTFDSDGPDQGDFDNGADPERRTEASSVVVSSDTESWLLTRETQLADLETGLTRKLKRALQDEQNDLLDRLRGLRDEPDPANLLPELGEHNARYSRASLPLVEEAASAGAAFAGVLLGSGAAVGESPDVEDLAAEAAASIVGPLRRRLEQVINSGSGEQQSVLVESLGSAYREWKSQRIERVAGDVLAAAFSRGTWSAAPNGTAFRWVVEDVDGPCPDCDDDALAGDLPKGEPFPTGQPHPPAHSGCRCLLVPVAG